MLPCSSKHDDGDGSLVDTKTSTYFRLRWSVFACPYLTNLQHLFCGQFGISGILSANISGSAFRNRVPPIIQIFSKPQMLGIAAWRIITRMQNINSFWNSTLREYPSVPVSFKPPLSVPSYAIATCIAAFEPQPTRTRPSIFIHGSPKTFSRWGKISSGVSMPKNSAIMSLAKSLCLAFLGAFWCQTSHRTFVHYPGGLIMARVQ